ncbi:substrate-binding domain-containing protein [Nocardia sp. NPDC058666]|uniref:substrate-binding domain-containing protein n=1 Tax=unclassified Nocardia TaxID=2637762 RepID=UPI003655F7D7
MDTRVTGQVQFPEVGDGSPDSDVTGALRNLQTPSPQGGSTLELRRLSLVLVRIENAGSAPITKEDYTLNDEQRPKVGLHLRFPGRKVIAVAVTDLTGIPDENLGPSSGIARRVEGEGAGLVGVIDLPKVRMDRKDHYKVLAVLNKLGNAEETAPPTLSGLRGGTAESTRSDSRPPRILVGLSIFLLALVLVQLGISLWRTAPLPNYCASGNVKLVGSTAMAPLVRTAARSFESNCPGATFALDFTGTTDGLEDLNEPALAPNIVAIGEGPKRHTFPDLSGNAFAVAPFSVVVHPDLGVTDLTTDQVQRLFRGQISNWREIGGRDLPVMVVDREYGSGSRFALEHRLLDWDRPLYRPEPCAGRQQLVHCEVGTSTAMADVVARNPGAVGYLESSTVRDAPIKSVKINGVEANRDTVRAKTYPFYSAEFAFHDYPGGQIPADSLAAKFIDYLTHGQGRLVVAEFGGIACVDWEIRADCAP